MGATISRSASLGCGCYLAAQLTLLMSIRALILSSVFFAAVSSHAATVSVTQGNLVIDYTGMGSGLFLSNPNHFNQSSSNILTNTQVESALPGDVLSFNGLSFRVNTGAPSSPTGRAIQNTTMTYDVSNLTGTVAGQVGLGGVDRWAYGFGGNFLMGDFSLEYSSSRAVGANSGWYLENHYTFPMIAFDLANVNTIINGNDFSLSGDLAIAPEFATNFGMFSDGSLVAGADYGNFSFTTAPEPSRALLGLAGLTGVFIRRRRSVALKA